MNTKTKLDALTSLRFFACLMIIFHHCSTTFFGEITPIFSIIISRLAQGVSFFFILSGFILAYAYREFNKDRTIFMFFKARFARIFPCYIFCFLLGYFLLNYNINWSTLIPFIFMSQSWLPNMRYYFSYNAVSWSISTEFSVYIVYPLLLIMLHKKPKLLIFISSIPLLIIIFINGYFSIPWMAPDNNKLIQLTGHALLYINPLSRIFEFSIGMFLYYLWKQKNNKENYKIATVYQFISVFALIIFILCPSISDTFYRIYFGPVVYNWSTLVGGFAVMAAVIYFFAQDGLLSRLISNKVFVTLGEISFSIYMCHQIILFFSSGHSSVLFRFSGGINFILYFLYVILLSYVIWVFVETPIRKFIVGGKIVHRSNLMSETMKINSVFSLYSIIALVGLLSISFYIHSLIR